MIASDQPSCFPERLVVAVSSRDDGTMLDRTIAFHDPIIVAHRRTFCAQVGLDYDSTAYQWIEYGDDRTYDVIQDITRANPSGVLADVLYTETPGVGLFLPVADCVATVCYDPVRRALALAHLGRHASQARTMTKTIEYMTERGSNPADIVVWMAPSVAASDYRMEYFTPADESDWQGFARRTPEGVYLDLAGSNDSLATKAGVLPEHIYRSTVNTARSDQYFSHSHGDTCGRFAVVAAMLS